MANRPALQDLHDFIKDPNTINASRLVTIPALYNVLKHEEKNGGNYPSSLIALCRWIHERGKAVLSQLVHESPPKKIDSPYDAIGWETVSCLHIN
jgi:hypothetical protein